MKRTPLKIANDSVDRSINVLSAQCAKPIPKKGGLEINQARRAFNKEIPNFVTLQPNEVVQKFRGFCAAEVVKTWDEFAKVQILDDFDYVNTSDD